MPSQTNHHDVPYMVDGDPLANVATIMQTLAERMEALLPISGRVTVTVTSSASGSAAVAFPAGKFPAGATIRVVCSTVIAGNTSYFAYQSSATNTGFTARVRHHDGTVQSTTVDVDWIAVLQQP